jgi:putative membrane protein
MNNNSRLYNILIWVISIVVPLLVTLLLFAKWDYDKLIFDLRIPNYEPIVILENLPIAKPLTFLPPIYATINGLTAITLVIAVYYIKRGKRKIHENLIKVCIALSLSFLVMYVAYHLTSDPTSFGGSGAIAYLYFFILISHILLSIVVIPLVLISYLKASQSDFVSHKKNC